MTTLWQPIETAPKDRFILISNGGIPDVVIYQADDFQQAYDGTWHKQRSGGWFKINGERSELLYPAFWLEIPELEEY